MPGFEEALQQPMLNKDARSLQHRLGMFGVILVCPLTE